MGLQMFANSMHYSLPRVLKPRFRFAWSRSDELLGSRAVRDMKSNILKKALKKKVYTSFLLPVQKPVIRLVTFPNGPNTYTENEKNIFANSHLTQIIVHAWLETELPWSESNPLNFRHDPQHHHSLPASECGVTMPIRFKECIPPKTE